MRSGVVLLGVLTAALAQAQVSFHPFSISSTLNGPVAIATADFNGDGIADLAISDTGSGVLEILLGVGNGTFREARTYPVPSSCQMASLFVGEFTGRHRPDILGLCVFESEMIVFPGNGDGTFSAPISTPLPELVFAGILPPLGLPASVNVAIGDFNGDGKLDLAIVLMSRIQTFAPVPTTIYSGLPTTIYLLLGNGNGTFRTPVPIPDVTQAVTLASGDFNRDGKLDLAYLTASGASGGIIGNFAASEQSLGILFGNGDGTFRPGPTYSWSGPLFALSAADVNGDGFLDLYGVGYKQTGSDGVPISVVTVMLGNGVGDFRQAFTAQDPYLTLANSYCLADFSGTGRLDLVEMFSYLTGEKMSFSSIDFASRKNNGIGGFYNAQLLSGTFLADYSTAAVCADFNGDGLPDMAFVAMPLATLESAFGQPSSFQQIDPALTRLPPGKLIIALDSAR